MSERPASRSGNNEGTPASTSSRSQEIDPRQMRDIPLRDQESLGASTDRPAVSSPGCCSGSSSRLDRRDFVKLAGLAAAAGIGRQAMPVMAGPFADENEYLKIIPFDKRLDADWVRSLSERGTKDVYRDAASLQHIGMPVGGLFAGTLYLGGDGRLWLWEIFNRDPNGIEPRTIEYQGDKVSTGRGANFIQPAPPVSPMQQGFVLRVGERIWPLDRSGFTDVSFEGRYPMGRVTYRDPDCPVEVVLEAFSPFIPLNLDDSSLPATVMSYSVKNVTNEPVHCELVGRLENAICVDSGSSLIGQRRNRIVTDDGFTALVCSAEPAPNTAKETRPDIVFEDFEKSSYTGWTAEGEAFGTGPIEMSKIPDYQGDVGGKGKRVVNSHAAAPGSSVSEKDAKTGTLTSDPFVIPRPFIHFLVGGGPHKGKTCVNLLVGGKVVASVTGKADNHMQPHGFSVAQYEGHEARIQIVDAYRQSWGNIGVDQIVFSDRPPVSRNLADQPDYGTMALALLGPTTGVSGHAATGAESADARAGLTSLLTGTVGRSVQLKASAQATVDFAITWHFPNLYSRGVGGQKVGNYYAARFASAVDVTRYLAANWERLAGTTRKWVTTWYDSTLPYWLLDRTMTNTGTLATTTCYRFEDGRFWAWEGIGCCAGTCTHVWHYAQAPGRLFPELERLERQRVNFGIGLHEDGGIGMRTGLEKSNEPAVDGQCGRILGVLREHQMSTDDRFLRQLWPKVRKAIEYMIRIDGNADGVLEGSQPNTLDAAWYGKISFTSSLYLAALRAGQVMAQKMEDPQFAALCDAIADKGTRSILETFNGEYFIQIEDPKHKDAIGVGPGCYIDQIFGQTWAHWVGLGQLFDRSKQLSALRALWKYNFVPDVGPFRQHFKPGRWYATAGDAGLLMCTWPRGGLDAQKQKHWQYMYFNECMTGFEWQAAAHMVWEGLDQQDLLEHGLAVGRAIHDRYHASLRNPYNEIECSDHYSRAMASYGLFQAVSGYQCDCPAGYLGFAPRLSADRFRCAFVAAEGWGTYAQQKGNGSFRASLDVHHGQVRIASLGLDIQPSLVGSKVTAQVGGRQVVARVERAPSATPETRGCVVRLATSVVIAAGESLSVELS